MLSTLFTSCSSKLQFFCFATELFHSWVILVWRSFNCCWNLLIFISCAVKFVSSDFVSFHIGVKKSWSLMNYSCCWCFWSLISFNCVLKRVWLLICHFLVEQYFFFWSFNWAVISVWLKVASFLSWEKLDWSSNCCVVFVCNGTSFGPPFLDTAN